MESLSFIVLILLSLVGYSSGSESKAGKSDKHIVVFENVCES